MTWVFGVRYNSDDRDISSNPDRFFRQDRLTSPSWEGNLQNCKKWNSVSEALSSLQEYVKTFSSKKNQL